MKQLATSFLALFFSSAAFGQLTSDQSNVVVQYIAGANEIGRAYDDQNKVDLNLYDKECPQANNQGKFKFIWTSTKRGQRNYWAVSCYGIDQKSQSVVLLMPDDRVINLPFSAFNLNQPASSSGGSALGFFQGLSDSINRANKYWNDSAAQTQRNTTNLTPGMTSGGGMSCTPDGRGGYNCR